ncbi:MAG: hypothetical protein KME46_32785 [Brasilonema angustatum HA4187-MV1]|jgi:hypothetical protein|nr:hypothetical protein [Brasilonema angustatum HA4187-MV1]
MDDISDILSGFGVDFNNPETLFDNYSSSTTTIEKPNETTDLSGFGFNLENPVFEESEPTTSETVSREPEPEPVKSDGLKSNQLRCSDGSIITYNECPDPKTIKCFSPIEIEAGWCVDRSKLQTFDELVEDYTQKMDCYNAKLKETKEKKGKKPFKPNLDIHVYQQIDTEFKFIQIIFGEQTIEELFTQESRLHVTTQINLLPGEDGITHTFIFVHPQFEAQINGKLRSMGKDPLPVLSCQDCDGFDYLRLVLGWDVKCKQATQKRLGFIPKFYLTLAAHNAEAELNLIFHGEMLKRVVALQKSVGYERIEKVNKVVKCIWEKRDKYKGDYTVDYVSLAQEVQINGDTEGYESNLRIVDTIKSHSVVSLGNFASASGYKLDAKDLLSKKDKEDIVLSFMQRPGDFLAYSLGDPHNAEIQYAFKNQISEMSKDLGFADKTIVPSLTVGGTVDLMDKAALATYLKLGDEKTSWRKAINEYVTKECQPYSPKQLVGNSAHTRALLAKGFGGRIGQNQPTVAQIPRVFKQRKYKGMVEGIELKGIFKLRKINGRYDCQIIVDIDISGCYAESQRMQLFFFGRPIIGGLRTDTISKNKYQNLHDLLVDFNVDVDSLIKLRNHPITKNTIVPRNIWGELLPGNHSIYMNCENLSCPQDMINSYIHPTVENHEILAKLLTDSMAGDKDAIKKIKQGYTKINTREIKCGFVGYEILQWIFFIASPKLRDEILYKSQVVAFAIYPKSARITSAKETLQEQFDDCKEQLETTRNNWELTNEIKVRGGKGYFYYGEMYADCHAWFGFTIGDLILNKYLSKRKVAQWVKKKCPHDLLYKLFCNTKFGVSISPLFNTSNIVIGNNITARARVLAWLMEKALNGFPTITDGCFFLINQILYSGHEKIDSRCINPDSPNSQLAQFNLSSRPLEFEFTGEDRNFTYKYTTKEWLTKNERILLLCDVQQVNKSTKVVQTFESLQPLFSGYFNPNDGKLDGNKTNVKPWDYNKEGKDFICTLAKNHLTKTFPLMEVLTVPTTKIKVVAKDKKYDTLPSSEKTSDMVDVLEKPRSGMADFEIKNIYHSGSNQGMANYQLRNTLYTVSVPPNAKSDDINSYCGKNGIILFNRVVEETSEESKQWTHEFNEYKKTNAFRGYESEKLHRGIAVIDDKVVAIERYNKENPAIDMISQIADDPHKVKRQNVAIKLVSLSINEYKKNHRKYDALGLKPGDQMKRPILPVEFSPSTYKYQNAEQLFGWLEATTKSKAQYGQSIEAFFIESDGSLNHQKMIEWGLQAIEAGCIDPIEALIGVFKKLRKYSKLERKHPEYDLLLHCKAALIGEKNVQDEILTSIQEELDNDENMSDEILNTEDE